MHWKRWKKGRPINGEQPRACASCGNEFTPHPKQPHATCCSRKCANSAQYAKRKVASPSRACEKCGELFAPLNLGARFCSQVRSNRWNTESRAREKTCADCGETFLTSALGRQHKTCQACSYERRLKRVRAKNKIRRYLKRGALGPAHSARDWERMLRRHCGLCAYCGMRKAVHRDHVIPISRGGRNSVGNILPACQRCNLAKGSMTIAEWKRAVRHKCVAGNLSQVI